MVRLDQNEGQTLVGEEDMELTVTNLAGGQIGSGNIAWLCDADASTAQERDEMRALVFITIVEEES